jgi:hypothetical protein
MPATYTGCRICSHVGVMQSECKKCEHYVYYPLTGADWEGCMLLDFIKPPNICAVDPGCDKCEWITKSCKACYAITRGDKKCTSDCIYFRHDITPSTGSNDHCNLISSLNCRYYQSLNHSCLNCTY